MGKLPQPLEVEHPPAWIGVPLVLEGALEIFCSPRRTQKGEPIEYNQPTRLHNPLGTGYSGQNSTPCSHKL